MSVRGKLLLNCACLAVLAALTLASGCSHENAQAGGQIQPDLVDSEPLAAAPPALQATLPALGQLDAVHLSSALTDLTVSGAEALQMSSGAQVMDTSCLLDATAAGPGAGSQAEWALYGFYAGGELSIQALRPQLSIPGSSRCWLLLANFQNGRWEAAGSFSSEDAFAGIELLSGGAAGYLSDGSMLYCAVLCERGNKATVEGLELQVNISGNVPPTAVLSPGSVSGEAPLFVELDASGSDAGGDIGDSIVLYEWDLDGDGNIDLSGPEATQSFNFTSGSWTLSVFVTDQGGLKSSASCEMNISNGGEPPLAVLEADVLAGEFPLEVSFDASGSTGGPDNDAIILFEWDWDGRGVYDEQSGTDPTLSHTFTSAGQFGSKLRITDLGGNQSTASILINVFDPSNAPPVALLSQTEAHAAAPPFTLYLDGSGSTAGGDNGDSIVKYEWDRDGDNIFELNSGTDPDIFITFSKAVRSYVRLRVTDEANNATTASCLVTVGTGAVTATSSGTPATYVSLDVNNGRPAIAYYESSGKDLCFIRANDELGASWGPVQVLDSAGRTGLFCSLKTINGVRCIAYYNDTDKSLKYIRSLDAEGDSWTVPQEIKDYSDPERWIGQYSSLIEVQGRPAIACRERYADNTSALIHIRAADSFGDSWPPDTQLNIVNDPGGFAGYSISQAIVDGCPAVAYTNSDRTQLRFSRSPVGNGDGWNEDPVVLDSGIEFAISNITLIDKPNNRPTISYRYLGELRVVNGTNPSGSSWASPIILDASGDVGSSASMALVDGTPMISFHDAVNLNLNLIRGQGTSSTDWHSKEVLDFSGSVGQESSIIDMYSQPGIAYLDDSAGSLNFMWAP
ncbi:hypothetical protein IT575_05120 [bacterium]|nr:hypothetical protein [bacterium]